MYRPLLAAITLVLPLAAWSAAADTAATPDYVTKSMQSPLRAPDAANDPHRQIAAIMTFTQVKPGQKVVELIPDGGYWTKVFSGIVGAQGHVYTIWPNGYQGYVKENYAAWQKYVTIPPYTNVSLIRSGDGNLEVPEAVDLVFTNQNYHDYHDKFMGPVDMKAFDKKVFDALKPGGYFVVIDNVANAGDASAPEKLHRIDPETVKQEVESAGFVFDASSDVLKNPADTHELVSYTPPMAGHNDQFIFRFKKPAQ